MKVENLKYNVPIKSTKKFKKYMVLAFNGNKSKLLHFGDTRYQDYTMHKNAERKKRYLARATKIKDKQGNLTKNNILSPNFWAIHLLWNKKTIDASYRDIKKRFL